MGRLSFMLKDSGLTDSQFMEVQRTIQNKQKIYLEDQDKEADAQSIQKMKEKLQAGARPPVKSKGLWSMITGLFK